MHVEEYNPLSSSDGSSSEEEAPQKKKKKKRKMDSNPSLHSRPCEEQGVLEEEQRCQFYVLGRMITTPDGTLKAPPKTQALIETITKLEVCTSCNTCNTCKTCKT